MVELAGVRRPNSGAGRRVSAPKSQWPKKSVAQEVSGPKGVPKLCCTCLKVQSNIEPKGLDGDSGHGATQNLQSPRADG